MPYAIDYIDPWVHPWPGCKVLFSKAWFSYNLGKLLEPIALRNVSLVTAVAPGYYEGVLNRYSWLDASRCVALPYGAEEADFHYLDNHPRQPYLFDPNDGNIHFVYAGAMLPRAYSTLEALFQAIIRLRNEDDSLARKLRFHFIGTGRVPTDPNSYNIRPWAERHRLLDIVQERADRIPFLDVLNHLKHAHAVLVLGSSEPHYTPSKVFQAVLSHRPVLALLHAKSTAVDMLNKSLAGIVVSFDEIRPAGECIDEIAQAVVTATRWRSSPEEVNWEVFRAFSAEAMAECLARAFDSVLIDAGVRAYHECAAESEY